MTFNRKDQKMIANVPPGKTYRVTFDANQSHVLVRRAGDGYEVEAAWKVMEGYDDDPGSVSYIPFGAGVAYAGVVAPAATSAEAIDILTRMCARKEMRQVIRVEDYQGARKIGSVAR